MPTDAATTTAAIATVRPHRRGGFAGRLACPPSISRSTAAARTVYPSRNVA